MPNKWNLSLTLEIADGLGDFADYPVGEESFYELSWGWDNLPAEVTVDGKEASKTLSKGLFLSGNNHSDDLFMFVKRKITGLDPNTAYSVQFSVLIESNVAPDRQEPERLLGKAFTLKSELQ